MDQGEAAVWAAAIASVVGVLGTALGSGITARSLASQNGQVTADADKAWHRQHRQPVFKAFHDSARGAMAALRDMQTAVIARKPVREAEAAVKAALTNLDARCWDVSLAGPEGVDVLAARIPHVYQYAWGVLRALHERLDAGRPPGDLAERAADAVASALALPDLFASAAREELRDPTL